MRIQSALVQHTSAYLRVIVLMARQAKEAAVRLEPLAEGFGQRVDVAARVVGTRAEAAAAMNLSDDQLNRIIREISVPSFAAVAGLALKSNCRFEWLAFSTGPQFGEVSTRKWFSGAEGTGAENFEEADTVMIRRYDIRIAAGHGVEVVEEQVATAMPFPRGYLERTLRARPEDVAIGEAIGDSNEPTISNGDLLLIHLRQRQIADGSMFVVRLGNELVVKRVQREIDGSLSLLSDNKAYQPRRLTQAEADQVDVIGKLIWSGGPV